MKNWKKKSVIFIYLVYGQKFVTENALLYSYLFVLDTTEILICLFKCNSCQTKVQIDFYNAKYWNQIN